MPRWWLSCCLIAISTTVHAAVVINAQQLSEEQELPALEGCARPVKPPGVLMLDDAVTAP
jgi:hypothetical protein